jgi:hypothetical protein
LDKAHYFGAYEYEREPQTITYSSQYPTFNIDQSSTHTEHKAATRLDYQLCPWTSWGAVPITTGWRRPSRSA